MPNTKSVKQNVKKDENMRNAGVSNVVGDSKARAAEAENARLNANPPPLVHVDPNTGVVLSQPMPVSKEANVNTVPGDGGVKDARPNNGNTNANPHTAKAMAGK